MFFASDRIEIARGQNGSKPSEAGKLKSTGLRREKVFDEQLNTSLGY